MVERRFALDVVMLDRAGWVLAVRRNVRPWRVVLTVPRTYVILEVPSGHDLDIAASQLLGLEPPRAGWRRLARALTAWAWGPSP